MKVELDFWNFIVMFMALVSAFWAIGYALMSQFEKRLDERFKALYEAASKSEAESKGTLKVLGDDLRKVDRDFLTFKAELPNNYVRRDDYILGQATIVAKVDGLSAQISEVKTMVAIHDRT